MSFVQDPRVSFSAVVSTAADGLSDIVDLEGYRVAAINMSTAWTDGRMTFLGGTSTASMRSLWDESGLEISLSTSAAQPNRSVPLSATLSLQVSAQRYLQLRSGVSTAAVAQSTTRTIGLIGVPL